MYEKIFFYLRLRCKQNRQLIFSPKIPYNLVAEPAEAGETNLTFPRWCIFLSPLELTLAKISEKEKCRAPRATPPSGSPPDGGQQSPQKFLHFRGTRKKFFN